MKFAVADTADGFLDAAVFIEVDSFSGQPPGDPQPEQQPGQVPESPIVLMILLSFIGFGFADKKRALVT